MSLVYHVILSVIFVLVLETARRRLLKPPYPPGPSGLPLIGNIRDLPTSNEWLTYVKWSRRYRCDVIHLNLLGSHLVVLNSAQAASDLLDKRSIIHSDRPRLPMLVELMGWDVFGFYPCDARWRAGRRLFSQFYNANVVGNLGPQMTRATHELLYRLANKPDELFQHLRLFSGSLIMNVTYGIDARALSDPHLSTVQAALDVSEAVANPGAFLVDFMPWLKHVPEWVPGAGFQKKAREWRKIIEATSNAPFEQVKCEMEAGVHTPSVTSAALEQLGTNDSPEAQALVRTTATAAFVGAFDTTISTLSSFFLFMILNPDVQKKAQEDIDRVVGRDRLPELSDLQSLPYVNAVIKETIRSAPPFPLGIVHRSMEDDVYNGHFIPAGSFVQGNIWAILHDENTYKNPEKFDPERFMKDGDLDPDVTFPDAGFGFGRRVCPGRHFADSSIFLAVSNVLAAFDIGNAIDEDGKTVVPNAEYTSGIIIHPLPFKYSIQPRSMRALELVTDAYSTHHPD